MIEYSIQYDNDINQYYIIDNIKNIKTYIDNNLDNENIQWKIEDRENLIDNLIDWISESKTTDKYLMKEDLKYLISLKDEYIFSSTNTNEYVAKSDNLTDFNNICHDFIYYLKETNNENK